MKDVILPGDMREILNQVVMAEKQAQANLIRRREETAATKRMEDNPILVRLNKLETLERVVEKVDRITVGGGLDSHRQITAKRAVTEQRARTRI